MDPRPFQLEWQNLNYSISKSTFNYRKFRRITNEIKILQNGNSFRFIIKRFTKTIQFLVSGSVKAGQLVAILGPRYKKKNKTITSYISLNKRFYSGAGKTTLLAAIVQRIRGNISGTILFNGQPINRKQMIRNSAFVPQFDITIDTLTPREHLQFMCELRLDKQLSRDEKAIRINEILWRLGLTRVANEQISRMSGGERKKLNLATEVSIHLCLYRSIIKK